MSGARFVVLEDRGVLAVTGPERASFLQGLVSNDTALIGGERAIYAALLTAQGKYLHDFMLAEHDGTIWLDGEASRLPDLKRRLSMYRLRANVAIEERPELAVGAVYGAPDLGPPHAPGAARQLAGGVLFVDPRLAALGLRAILPRQRIRQVLRDEVGAVEAQRAGFDRLRLSLGVPDGSRDLVVDKSILLEAGFDELNGIDWHKGCYIGQELTARTKYRGLIRKRLLPVRIDGPAPAVGTIITRDGHEAGEMRSSCDRIGLALLRLESIRDGRLTANGVAIEPLVPDWMRLPQ